MRSIVCVLLWACVSLPAWSQSRPALIGAAVVAKEGIDPVTKREVICDLPADQHLRNIRGRNGQGCCVYASGEMMARFFDFRPLYGVLKEGLGGANDGDVERMFKRKAPGFKDYVQAQGKSSVDMLDWAMRTGRLACVTYGAAHMVILVHMDAANVENPRACIVDNNQPRVWQWMSRAEFLAKHSQGGAWSYCLILPPPPPIPIFPKG